MSAFARKQYDKKELTITLLIANLRNWSYLSNDLFISKLKSIGEKKRYLPPPTVGDFALKPKGQLIHQTKVWRRKMLLWIASDYRQWFKARYPLYFLNLLFLLITTQPRKNNTESYKLNSTKEYFLYEYTLLQIYLCYKM
jgi:hypothetical protein